MTPIPKKLQQKLESRSLNNALRKLVNQSSLADFSSNDYLGFSKSRDLFNNAHNYLVNHNLTQNGSTGSRLLSGNHELYEVVETLLCEFHNCKAALVFNSGYDANVGLFSSVPQRGDIILYDEFIHASIRDGLTMSNANAYKFKHNNLRDLQTKLLNRTQSKSRESDIYIVTESVFSMDGDSPDLVTMSEICKNHKAHFIVDEAHALGVFNNNGSGLIQELNLENDVFARLVTFGKGLGCHGAAILGSKVLKQYLVNFARSLIYTTGLPPHSLAIIKIAYEELSNSSEIETLHKNIKFFKSEITRLHLDSRFIKSDSAIQSCIVTGNDNVKSIALKLQEQGFDVKPILSPTVPEEEERLRFCLHSFNKEKEITEVLELLTTFVNESSLRTE